MQHIPNIPVLNPINGITPLEISEFLYNIPRASEDRREFTAEAAVAQWFYEGHCHFLVDSDRVTVKADPSLMRGMMNAPILPNVVDRAVASLFSEFTIYEPASVGTSVRDVMIQEAGRMFLADYFARNPVFENIVMKGRDLFNTGRAFEYLYQDEDWVPVVMAPEVFPVYIQTLEEEMRRKGYANYRARYKEDKLQQMPDGRIRIPFLLPVIKECNKPAFGFLVNTGATCLSDCAWFICHDLRALKALQADYADTGFDWSQLNGRTISDRRAPNERGNIGTISYGPGRGQQTGESFSAEAGLVRHFDCWKRVGPKQWYHAIIVQDARGFWLIYDEQAEDHPYVDYTTNQVTGKFWCKGYTYKACDLARAYAKSLTDIQRNFQESMKDVILTTAQGMKQLSNRFATVIEVDPRSPFGVKRLEMPAGAHQQLLALLALYESSIYKMVGLSDISRGIVQTHQTQGALQLARSADLGPLGNVRTIFDERQRLEKYPKVLRMMQAITDAPRLFAPAGGADAAYLAEKALRGADLGDSSAVVIVETREMAESQSARAERAIAMMTAGIFQSPEEVDDYVIRQRSIFPKNTTEVTERNKARVENGWISSGVVDFAPMMAPAQDQAAADVGPSPLVYASMEPMIAGQPNPNFMQPLLGDTDIDEIHVEEHERAEREKTIPVQLLPYLKLHIQEHLTRMEQNRQRQIAEALEMATQQSLADHAGQMASQRIADINGARRDAIKQQQSPSDGGRKSGEVRRGERRKSR